MDVRGFARILEDSRRIREDSRMGFHRFSKILGWIFVDSRRVLEDSRRFSDGFPRFAEGSRGFSKILGFSKIREDSRRILEILDGFS